MLEDMKELQLSVDKVYNPQALFVSNRKHIVDWMQMLGEELKFGEVTIHHCISLYDFFLA